MGFVSRPGWFDFEYHYEDTNGNEMVLDCSGYYSGGHPGNYWYPPEPPDVDIGEVLCGGKDVWDSLPKDVQEGIEARVYELGGERERGDWDAGPEWDDP